MDTVNIFNTELRNKIKVDCDLIPGVWVEFYDDLLIENIYSSTLETDDIKQGIDNNLNIIKDCIHDWNFADDKGKLDITVENLRKLPLKLLTWISEKSSECVKTTADKKKV